MVWTEEQTYINKRFQFGVESTHGTAVACPTLLQCFDGAFQIMADTQFYVPTGRRYPLEMDENTEWVEGTWSGIPDYSGIVYPLNGVFGAGTISAHLASTTAKDHTFIADLTGPSTDPKTYTIMQGDTNGAHKVAYALFNEFSYTFTRKSMQCSFKNIAQSLTTGVTITSNPTAVALTPIPGKHLNVYLDSTNGGLGTTQLLDVLQVQYQFSNMWGTFFPINRSNLSFTNHLAMKPTCTVKLLMEWNTAGQNPLTYLQAGTTYFLRVDCLGTVAIASDGPGSIFNEFKHDMAIKFDKPSAFQDKDGVFAVEWPANIVEDPTWAAAQKLVVTNLIASL